MLFQLVLTQFFKTELFSCLPKADHLIMENPERKIQFLKQKENYLDVNYEEFVLLFFQ